MGRSAYLIRAVDSSKEERREERISLFNHSILRNGRGCKDREGSFLYGVSSSSSSSFSSIASSFSLFFFGLLAPEEAVGKGGEGGRNEGGSRRR